MTLVLAGGRGERLEPLTRISAKPVLPFAGRRLIDFTLLNCVRSGIGRVVVLTQYRATTIKRHVEHCWADRLERIECFDSRHAGRRFRGTADAVRAALDRYREGERVLILAADHVYSMDYRRMLELMDRSDAAGVLSAVPHPLAEAHRLGVLSVGSERGVDAFVEKPSSRDAIPARNGVCLASMGIYLFRRSTLADLLASDPELLDFGFGVVPAMLRRGDRLLAHEFGGGRPEAAFWRDIGDIDSLHGALLDLVGLGGSLAHDFLCELEYVSAARAPGGSSNGAGGDSWVGSGAVLSGASVSHSVIGPGSRVERHAEVTESILFENVVVGAGSRLRRVVVEAGARIPAGTDIGFDFATDNPAFALTPGGVVVVPSALEPESERPVALA